MKQVKKFTNQSDFEQNFDQNKFMTQVATYMRLYYLKIESKITSKHILNGNKALFESKGRWIGAKNVHIPTFYNRLSSLCFFS